MIQYIEEFFGSFLFIFMVLKSGLFGKLGFIVVGLSLAFCLVFVNKTPGHFNPLISAISYIKDPIQFPVKELATYVIVQLAGGLLALALWNSELSIPSIISHDAAR
jgi:glycerol uptake facilitator-like aquaporin